MARNPYFNFGVKSEQNLHEDLIIEALKIYGMDVYYLPRSVVKVDTILNEDIESKFGAAFKVEMYVESVDGFGGDGILMSKFGLEIRDQVNLIISRKRWEQLVGRFAVNNVVRPGEGDLIYFPLSKSLFEIRFVEDKIPFFQLGNAPVYKLSCEMFEYSGEALDTGVEVIDGIELRRSQETTISYSSISGTFNLGEDLTQDIDGFTITGELSNVNLTENTIGVVGIRASDGSDKTFGAGTITGISSAATVTAIDATVPLESTSQQTSDAQNAQFETEGNAFIDFTEINPFGEANYISTK